MSSVSAWSTAAAVPKYDDARHTRVSRHFCICGADLESWVHCVVHIFYPFWPNWMEGNKGIHACPKYSLLPGLGLAGKPVLSELLYKLVPSTYIIEKIACMWTWKIKNFIFSSFYGILEDYARALHPDATGWTSHPFKLVFQCSRRSIKCLYSLLNPTTYRGRRISFYLPLPFQGMGQAQQVGRGRCKSP